MDVVPERLELARDLGADHIVNASDGDPIAAIQDLTGGLGASAVIETSGNPTARGQAVTALRPFGRCCYVGIGDSGAHRHQQRR